MPARTKVFPLQKRSLLLLIFSITLVFLSFIGAKTIFAQTFSGQPSQESSLNPGTPQTHHTFVEATVIELLSSVHCVLTGINLIDPQLGCLGVDQATGKLGYAPQEANGSPKVGGAIGLMQNWIAVLYTPPATTGMYLAYLGENFGINKSYAQVQPSEQGYGFEGLRIVLRVYTLTRNVSYMVFVLAFVIIGIAIMLRVKIDPRTVMTVQNQIPRIIISIILITFSYAIVGLLIDAMWVLTYVSVNTLTTINKVEPQVDEATGVRSFTETDQPIISPAKATYSLLDTPFGYLGAVYGKWDLIREVGSAVGEVAAEILLNPIRSWDSESCSFTSFSVGSCAKKAVYGLAEGILKLLGGIIVAIALFVVLFRIWFMLIKSFGMVILQTVAAPLWITAGLFPGSKLSFTQWLRNVSAHLLVFPAAVTLFLLAAIILDSFSNARNAAFIPPLIGNVQGGGEFGTIIGFGIILLIPDLLNMLRDALKTPASQYGGNVRNRFTAGNPLGATAGLGQFAYHTSYIRQMPVLNKFIGQRNKASQQTEGLGRGG